MAKKTDETSSLFQLELFSRGKGELLKIVRNWLKKGSKLHLVMTPNPEQVVQAQQNREFLQTLQAADLLLPDGIGLVWAAQILGQPIEERITGIWLVRKLLFLAQTEQLTVLIIGGRDYASGDEVTYQGYELAWTPGFTQVTAPTQAEKVALADQIKTLQPSIVFVALGAPHQELWLSQNQSLLEENQVKIAMAVGGSFDFLFGKVKRAPRWLRSLGLEWLFRLVVEPWRWRRQRRLIRFVSLVWRQRFS